MASEESSTTTIPQIGQQTTSGNTRPDTAVSIIKLEWRTVPYWFAALAGFVYGTGFLVDYTFLGSMGVKDPMTEIVKARHIYVGLLCLQFPVSLAVVVLGFIRYSRKVRTNPSSGEGVKPSLTSILTVIVLLFAFYMLIGFSRAKSSYSEHQVAVFVLFLMSITGLILARGIEVFLNEARAKYQAIDELFASIPSWVNPLTLIRRIIFLTVLGLTIYIFWHLWPLIGEILWEGAYLYVGLIAMVIVILWRIDTRSESFSRMGLRATMVGITLALSLAFLYFAILVFAARIYPYIPAGRGGGDYTTETPSVLFFDAKFKDALPRDVIDDSSDTLRSKPLYILRDTSEAVFVAVPVSENKERNIHENGPPQWRRLGRENKPQALFAIKREAILATQYKNE